jgi:hypothetical protein
VIAMPNPLEAPVITAVFPLRLNSFIFIPLTKMAINKQENANV